MVESMMLLIAVPESGKCDHPNKLVTGPHIVTLITSAMHLIKLIEKTSNEIVNKS